MALGWLSGQAPFPEEPPPPAGLVDDPTFYLPDLQNMRIGLAVSDTDQFRRVAEYTGQPVEQIGRVNGRIVRFVPEIGQYAYIEPRALTTTGADPSNNNVPPMTPLGQGVSDFFGDGMLGQAALGLAEPWRYFDEAEAIGSNTLGSAAAAVGPSMGDAASITGGLLALPAGPGASVLAAGAGGAGGDALRQMLDRAIAGEDLRGLDYWNMAGHGLLGAVGQGLGLTAGRAMGAFQRNGLPVTAAEQRLIASNPLWLDTARKLIDYAKGRGIYISPGEATGLRSMLQDERLIRRVPEGQQMVTAIEQRGESDIPRAFREDLGELAPSSTIDEAVGLENTPYRLGTGIRGAAGKIVEDTRAARSAVASPFYDEAFKSPPPDISPVIAYLQRELVDASPGGAKYGAMQEALRSIAEQVPGGRPGELVWQPRDNFKLIHNAKLTWDSILSRMSREGYDRADIGSASHSLNEAQDMLVDILRTNPQYRAGYDAYIAESAPVEMLTYAGVKAIADMDGLAQRHMLDRIFAAGHTTPERMTQLRRLMYHNGEGARFNAAARTWLEGQLVKALDAEEGANIAARLYRGIWRNEDQRAIVVAALGGPGDGLARVQGMERLMEVVRAARRALPEGAATFSEALNAERVLGGAGTVARTVTTPLNTQTYLNLGDTVLRFTMWLRGPEARQAWADRLMNSAQVIEDLKRLRTMPAESQAARTLTAQILTQTMAAAAALPFEADAPPAGLRQDQQ